MRVERKEERDEGHRMGHKNMLNIVLVLYSTSTVGTIIF